MTNNDGGVKKHFFELTYIFWCLKGLTQKSLSPGFWNIPFWNCHMSWTLKICAIPLRHFFSQIQLRDTVLNMQCSFKFQMFHVSDLKSSNFASRSQSLATICSSSSCPNFLVTFCFVTQNLCWILLSGESCNWPVLAASWK